MFVPHVSLPAKASWMNSLQQGIDATHLVLGESQGVPDTAWDSGPSHNRCCGHKHGQPWRHRSHSSCLADGMTETHPLRHRTFVHNGEACPWLKIGCVGTTFVKTLEPSRRQILILLLALCASSELFFDTISHPLVSQANLDQHLARWLHSEQRCLWCGRRRSSAYLKSSIYERTLQEKRGARGATTRSPRPLCVHCYSRRLPFHRIQFSRSCTKPPHDHDGR